MIKLIYQYCISFDIYKGCAYYVYKTDKKIQDESDFKYIKTLIQEKLKNKYTIKEVTCVRLEKIYEDENND